MLRGLFAWSLLAFGCTHASECPPGPCRVTTATARLLDGTITWTGVDGAAHTVNLADASGPCHVGTTWITGSMLLAEDVVVDCHAGTEQFVLHVGAFGDALRWPSGTTPLSDSYTPFADVCATPGCTPCEATFVADTRLVVEASAGGAAPSPKIVSSDYRRVFRVEIDPARSLANVHGCPPSPKIGVTLSVRFEQTASDFRETTQPCMCE